MSAYCHAGVTCSSVKTGGEVTICISKNYEFKLDPDLCLPAGLMLAADPDRPEFLIPFTAEDGQEPCAVLGEEKDTSNSGCAVTHAIPVAGEFRFEHILWPESVDTYEKKREIMNDLLAKGICILHAPC